jgi:SAM-dependent methyltransferase
MATKKTKVHKIGWLNVPGYIAQTWNPIVGCSKISEGCRHNLTDKSSKGGSRELIVDPDYVADFKALPFNDCQFALGVFDPPHFARNGASGWMAKKYGTLGGDWREELHRGFQECFRVLRPSGTLIFKWCDDEIPLSQILALTPEKPLFGHKSGKQQKTHWVAFMKPNA